MTISSATLTTSYFFTSSGATSLTALSGKNERASLIFEILSFKGSTREVYVFCGSGEAVVVHGKTANKNISYVLFIEFLQTAKRSSIVGGRDFGPQHPVPPLFSLLKSHKFKNSRGIKNLISPEFHNQMKEFI